MVGYKINKYLVYGLLTIFSFSPLFSRNNQDTLKQNLQISWIQKLVVME